MTRLIDLKQVGTIVRNERSGDVFLVMDDDKEIYFFKRSSFAQALTRYVDKGVNTKDIDVKELGFV